MCPSATLVEISPRQYSGFGTNSIIDCNYVLEKTVEQLVEKLSQGKLKMKAEMDVTLAMRLGDGVIKSPLVERRIKKMLQESSS